MWIFGFALYLGLRLSYISCFDGTTLLIGLLKSKFKNKSSELISVNKAMNLSGSFISSKVYSEKSRELAED